MQILDPRAEKYLDDHSSSTDELLSEIFLFTTSSHAHAHMISGPVQGQLLRMLSQMINPLKVLEIGTFTGYSALCLAAGLKENGVLHTIEMREEDANIAQEYFNRSPFKEKIKLHIGDAKTVIDDLHEEWDLVFIDADKTGYIDYYELTLPQIAKGGFMIADNVLFHGSVLEENISGKNAKAIDAFNKHVASDSRTEQVLLSVRDGISIIRKI